jgi:hypothetical protein
MAKKPPPPRTLQRRWRQLQGRLETLIYQRDFFLDEIETLRLVAETQKHLAMVARELDERKGRAA